MSHWTDGTDSSFYYRERASADVASMNSTAALGNLADAMRDSVTLLPGLQIVSPVTLTGQNEGDSHTVEPAKRPS